MKVWLNLAAMVFYVFGAVANLTGLSLVYIPEHRWGMVILLVVMLFFIFAGIVGTFGNFLDKIVDSQ